MRRLKIFTKSRSNLCCIHLLPRYTPHCVHVHTSTMTTCSHSNHVRIFDAHFNTKLKQTLRQQSIFCNQGLPLFLSLLCTCSHGRTHTHACIHPHANICTKPSTEKKLMRCVKSSHLRHL